MVCTPLDTVDELLAWVPGPSPALAPAAFIPPYVPPPPTVQHELLRRGRLLVCHDMKGTKTFPAKTYRCCNLLKE